MDQVDDRFIRSVVDSIRGILDGDRNHGTATTFIRQTFLEQNSETESNLHSINSVTIGEFVEPNEQVAVGLTVGKDNLSLSHIFWKGVESQRGAELIRETFPMLSVQEAKAVLRVCTVVLTNLEGIRPPSDTPEQSDVAP